MNQKNQNTFETGCLETDEWPSNGLENIACCPVCNSTENSVAYEKLRDRAYGCAPGSWKIQECRQCGSAYLNPRPNPQTIGLAYKTYFTHSLRKGVEYAKANWWRRFRIRQRNSYLNVNYGYSLKPAAWSPLFISALRRRRFDSFTGHLHFPGPGARLLDVGCGNGAFLRQMRSLGWNVCGVEPDNQAASCARDDGLDVRTGILTEQNFPEKYFDGITVNHVIEHLHEPLNVLRQCWRLLKPGGQITVATPNFGSCGHKIYDANWWPLDPPRHLVIFTEASLRSAMEKCGFTVLRTRKPSLKAQEIFRGSQILLSGGPNKKYEHNFKLPWPASLKTKWLAFHADLSTQKNPSVAEEIVLLGKK